MNRKVFISVLGTGLYNKCQYYTEGFVFETRFIQQATLAMLAKQGVWTEHDIAYILLTEGAKKNNWQIPSQTRFNPRTKVDEPYVGLKNELEFMMLPMSVIPIDIKDGKDEKEMWDIFDTIYDLLQEGDQLYFDITHGFRYLPMFAIVLGNYAKLLKNVMVRGITYGNFEAGDKEHKPIMNLLSLSSLQDWTSASADFLHHGDTARLKEYGIAELQPILRKAKGSDAAATRLRNLCNALSTFSEELKFCRGMDVLAGTSANKVNSLVADADKNYLRPFVPLFNHIKNAVAPFKNNMVGNMVHAARLCIDFGNYQAAATLLEEGVVTFFCIRHHIDPSDDKRRDYVNKAIAKKQCIIKNKVKDYRPSSEDAELIIDDIVSDDLIDNSFINYFTCLQTDVRNDINHAGMRRTKAPAKTQNLRKNLEKVLAAMERLVESNDTSLLLPTLPKLLLNLSNHPYSEWLDSQRQAAEAFGPCQDLPFPKVGPDADEAQMATLVDQYTKQVMTYAKNHQVTVHLMGEMCFTYRMVKRLTSLGIRCICSTSYRMVRAEGCGKRYVEFHFNQFRDYESYDN